LIPFSLSIAHDITLSVLQKYTAHPGKNNEKKGRKKVDEWPVGVLFLRKNVPVLYRND